MCGRQDGYYWVNVLIPAHLGSPGQRAAERLCVSVCVCSYALNAYSGW